MEAVYIKSESSPRILWEKNHLQNVARARHLVKCEWTKFVQKSFRRVNHFFLKNFVILQEKLTGVRLAWSDNVFQWE